MKRYALLLVLTTLGSTLYAQSAGTGFSLSTISSGGSFSGTAEIVREIVTTLYDGSGIDIDGDGNGEIIVYTVKNTPNNSSSAYIFEATANDTYEQIVEQALPGDNNVIPTQLLRGVDVGNIDDDPALELIATSGTGASEKELTAYDISTDGSFTFTQFATSTTIMGGGAAATLNQVRIVPSQRGNATRNDILISNATGSAAHLEALEWNGTTGFTSFGTEIVESGVVAFDAADLDSDGELELVVLTEDGAAERGVLIYAYRTSGSPVFEEDGTITGGFTSPTGGGEPNQVVDIGDIDNDSDLDVVCSDYNGNDIYTLYRTSGTNYTAVLSINETSDIRSLGLGDRDADGLLEVYYGTENSGAVQYREQSGIANNFTSATGYGAANNLLTGLGAGNEAGAISFYRGTSVPPFLLDGDSFRDVVVGRNNNISGDELFVLESVTVDPSLPVSLNTFTGSQQGNDVTLVWETESETDNAGFLLYRNGSLIASHRTAPALVGKGSTPLASRYFYTDRNLADGTLTYELLSQDYSGLQHRYDKSVLSIAVRKSPYRLAQNYPNPFNPQTTIDYGVSGNAQQITLKVFDVLGREVTTLVNEKKAAGNYSVRFNAAALPSGVYFYRLTASGSLNSQGGYTETKKMTVTK